MAGSAHSHVTACGESGRAVQAIGGTLKTVVGLHIARATGIEHTHTVWHTNQATVSTLADFAVVKAGCAGEHGGQLIAVSAGRALAGSIDAGEARRSTWSAHGVIAVHEVARQTRIANRLQYTVVAVW